MNKEQDNIILIGMMGSGKTTVGQAISKNQKWPFIDTDDMIEEQSKMTIPHIFEQYGESYFRRLEAGAVRNTSTFYRTVISTGGGIVLNQENMSILNESGFVVYLHCSAVTLYERTIDDFNRPLLLNSDSDRLARIEDLLILREPLYTKYSNFVIDAGKYTIDELSRLICDEYRRYQRAKY